MSCRAQAGPVLYVDADGCPVKEEIYRVARRYGLTVYLVAARVPGNLPKDLDVRPVAAGTRFDAADNWIAARTGPGDLVVTSDILLADRCLKAGARVITPRGDRFTEHNIGSALAGRELREQLRQMGVPAGGPRPFDRRDRSRFLQTLDEEVQRFRRLQARMHRASSVSHR